MTYKVVKRIQRPFTKYMDFVASVYDHGLFVFGLRNTLSNNPAPGYKLSFSNLEDAKRFVQYVIEAIKEFEAMQNGDE